MVQSTHEGLALPSAQPDGPDLDRYHVPNLERALALMELLAETPHGASLAELADSLKFPKNSVYRIISTLHACGFVNRDELTKRYRLSRKLLALGYAALGESNLVELSLDVMRTLRDTTQETALLGVLNGTEGLVLEQVSSHQLLKFVVDPGMRFPLHSSAPGKAILAALPERELSSLLPRLPFTRFNARTLTTPELLLAELEQVRTRGYALDHAEEIDGLYCVGAAICNHINYPVAAIWVTGPSFRFLEENLEHTGDIVAAHARTLSTRLGWTG